MEYGQSILLDPREVNGDLLSNEFHIPRDFIFHILSDFIDCSPDELPTVVDFLPLVFSQMEKSPPESSELDLGLLFGCCVCQLNVVMR